MARNQDQVHDVVQEATRCLDYLNEVCSAPVGGAAIDPVWPRDVLRRLLVEIELQRLFAEASDGK